MSTPRITPSAMPKRSSGAAPAQHQMHNDYDYRTGINTYWCECDPQSLTSKRQMLKHMREVSRS